MSGNPQTIKEGDFSKLVHDVVVRLEDRAQDLSNLSESLYRCGHEKLGDEVSDHAVALGREAKTLKEGYAADLSKRLQQAQEAVGKTLGSMLGAAERSR